jgi:hypothetical protein
MDLHFLERNKATMVNGIESDPTKKQGRFASNARRNSAVIPQAITRK